VKIKEKIPANQQSYAEAAYRLLRADIMPQAPEDVIVAYGFPKGRHGLKAIGQCFQNPKPENKSCVIFIRPCQWKTPLDVLHVLVHEMVHAATPGAGHRGAFKILARNVGLEGPLRATFAGKALCGRLNAVSAKLGPFPAADFDFETKKQKSRLRLYQCDCPIKVRVASDSFGATCHDCRGDFKRV
jgi:hypothetical protein